MPLVLREPSSSPLERSPSPSENHLVKEWLMPVTLRELSLEGVHHALDVGEKHSLEISSTSILSVCIWSIQ